MPAISYVAYMGQMFWPSGLAVLYPFAPGAIGVSEVVLSLVVLAGISTGVFVLRHRRPYLLTGWLWYLGMLVPVIGIIQVGLQARADRYTYLPQIGLYVLLTWAAADLCAGWRHRRVVLGGGATVILAALIFCARAQTSYWRNSESLWTHTLACTSDNFIAHNNLGNALLQKGRVDEAIAHFQKALQINTSANDQFFARFNFDNLTGPATNPDQTAIDPSFGITYIDRQRNVVGTYTHTVSPRLTLVSSNQHYAFHARFSHNKIASTRPSNSTMDS